MASSRVYFAIFGSGLGHATRVLEVSGRLPRDEFEFRYSSSGQGFAHLKSEGVGQSSVECPPLDVEWASGGGFSSHRVLPGFPFMFNSFLRQVAFERKSIGKFAPKVVVTDSRLSAVVAARSQARPVITMLNQFKILFPPRFRNSAGRVYERIAGDVLGLLWSLSDRVLLTDLPPPYTIGEGNLEGLEVSNIVQFVGFTTPRGRSSASALERVKRTLSLDGRPLVYCQVSGPDATKGRFAGTLLAAAPKIAEKNSLVISMGYSGGSPEPRRLGSGAWLFDWCPVKDELFDLSTVLVARAGHSTIGQCIDHAKPAVLVPIHNHPEQISNAEKFSRLGLGIAIKSERLTPQNLVESVESCLGDPGYRRRMEPVSAVSSRYDGVERCAEVIRAFS